jgi:RHS repeat-associated protein
VTGLTNSDGKLIQSYTYDAFGNILQVDSYLKGKQTVTNPYRFSTKEYNSRSGLIYFGARYYDPKIGRFITPDPLTWGPDDARIFKKYLTPVVPAFQNTVINKRGIIEPDTIINSNHQYAQLLKGIILRIGVLNPQIQHRYTYCRNNPINSIDPYGLDEWGQLMREQTQLQLEFLWKFIGFYAGIGGALITIGVLTENPILIVFGFGWVVWGIVDYADWAQRWGDLQMRIKRYRYRKAFGEDWQEYWPYYYSP